MNANLPARTVSFNKENWTGETITVKVGSDNTFTFAGYRFALVEKSTGEFVSYNVVGSGWTEPLFTVGKFADDKLFAAMDGDIIREHADPVVAAVKLLCMTL